MVAVHSTMLPLGTPCPDFDLADGHGRRFKLADLSGGRGLVVAFISNHCPFVHHLREGLAAFGRDLQALDVSMVAIGSNDVARYPADSPALMAEEAETWGYVFPYLYDETQAVAKAFKAACTPDFYLFDAELKLVYRGQFDPSRPGSGVEVTGSDLRAAVRAMLAGEGALAEQVPSIGCNIKWKLGAEPPWFG